MTLEEYILKLSERVDLFQREIEVEHMPADVPVQALQLTVVDAVGPVWIEPV